MSSVFQTISLLFIPAVFITIIIYGLYKRVPLYDYFVEGAKEGLQTAIDILPFLISIFIAIKAVTISGGMAFLEDCFSPLLNLLGIPSELVSLILLRPVSGSGSLAIVEQVLLDCVPDSFAGRVACVMAGSCETVFYVLALYFGVTAVKHMRHAFAVGIIGYLAGIFASVLICQFI